MPLSPSAPVERQLAFIGDPDLWPRWPVLPVVERSGQHRAGIIVDGSGPTVFITNMFALEGGLIGPQLAKLDRIVYPDFDSLVGEWRID